MSPCRGSRRPVHHNSRKVVYAHDDTKTKVCLQFYARDVLPLLEQSWLVYQFLLSMSVGFTDNKIHNLVSKNQIEEKHGLRLIWHSDFDAWCAAKILESQGLKILRPHDPFIILVFDNTFTVASTFIRTLQPF